MLPAMQRLLLHEEALCSGCSAPAKCYCSLCCRVQYCSKECSEKNWPSHKAYCIAVCDPPGVMPLPVVDAATQGIVRGVASLELPAAAATVQAPIAAANPAHTPTVAEPRGWESYEMLSEIEFTKLAEFVWLLLRKSTTGIIVTVLVVATGLQDLWVNVFRNGSAILQLRKNLEAAAATMVSCVPFVGQCYAGCYEGEWCRVVVLAVTPELKVRYLDYGNEEALSLHEMRALPAQFKSFPAQAIRIRLAWASQSRQGQFKTDSVMFVKRVSIAADGYMEVVLKGDEQTIPQEIPVQELPGDKFAQVVVLESSPDSMLVNLSSQGAVISSLCNRLARGVGNLCRAAGHGLGQLVAAEFEDDSGSGWYRARVVSSSPLRVYFLDFGNEAEVPTRGIKPLPAEFCKLPAQAVPVKLVPGSAQRFQGLPANAKLNMRAMGKEGGFVLVQPADLDANKPVSPPANPACIVYGNQKLPCLRPAQVNSGTQQDVYWVYRQGAEGFVQERGPDNLVLLMAEKIKSAAEGTSPLAAIIGEPVLAFFEGEWARAVVVSQHPELRIRFLDFGNEATSAPSDIRPMPAILAQIPAQCRKVRLSPDSAPSVGQLGEFAVFSGTFLSQGPDSVWNLRGQLAL